MTEENKVLYVVPAREGSKGVLGKNIKPLNGKPLICYTLEVARSLTADEDICISTDDEKIKNVVEQAGLKVPFLRPEELASDESGMYEVLSHALNYFLAQGKTYDLLVLLQPTSPFRKVEHVKEALESWKPGIEMVVGVKTTKANPYYVLFEENEQGFLVKSKPGNFKTRQECPPVYEINGAVYIMDVNSLLQRPITSFERIKKYMMDEFSSLDIDTEFDWKFAEFLLSQHR
jgi:CMP-N,N'-diacetyllegionaminic acid synthase